MAVMSKGTKILELYQYYKKSKGMGLSTVPQLSVLSNYKYDSWHGISQRQCFAQPENRLSQFTSVSEAPHGLAGKTGI